MKCFSCNKEVDAEIKYCVYCGTLLFKECPKCKKIIMAVDDICKNCGINIDLYEKGIQLLEEAKQLEEEHKYEEAKLVYEKIKEPELIEEANKLISEIDAKIIKLKKYKTESEKLFNEKKWSKAKKILLEIRNLLPEDKDIAEKLEITKTYIRKRNKKIQWIIIGCVAIFGSSYYWHYYNKLENLATRELIALLNSESIDIKYASAIILGERQNKHAIPILERFIYSRDDKKRIYTIATLIELGKFEYIPILKDMMEKEVSIKIAAAWMLTKLGDTTIINEMAQWLGAEEKDLKITSAVLLLNMGYSSGVEIIKEGLKSEKIKTLYALYLLGENIYLKKYKEIWEKEVKNLLYDEIDEVRLISAFLLDKVGVPLSYEDSAIIQEIMWSEFMKAKEEKIHKIEEIPEILPFSIINSIINRKKDEDILIGVKKLRERCELSLAKLELKDETILNELIESTKSDDNYEKLCASIALFVYNQKKFANIIKELIKNDDEMLKFSACKLVLQFCKK